MSSKWSPGTLLLLVLLVACTSKGLSRVPTATPTQPGISQDIEWLTTHAIPFETSDPTKPLEDLEPLKTVVGEARIVALGDATDGTHEFFQMKHRILVYLVEEMGFNTFAMAAGYPEAEPINRYIQTGEGDPAELLKGLYYPIWNTQEVLDMIEWMRAYNADPAHARKISFYGFDMAFDEQARENVRRYFDKVDPAGVLQIKDDYSCYPQFSDACMKKLQDAADLLRIHRADYIAQSSQAEFEKALHNARIVIQKVTTTLESNDNDLHDQYMTENVEWIMDQAGPEGKMVLWAHNWTVSKYSDGPHQSLGDRLHQKYGERLLVFGFLFYHGSFHAIGVGSQNAIETFHAAEPPGDSYEFLFQAAGMPRFFLDMRPARAEATDQAWLFTPHPSYQVGGLYDPNNPPFYPVQLAGLFDGVIYFKDTTPSQLLDQ